MPILSIILSIVQWLVVLLLVIIGMYRGARRGFKKTYYYTLTNFLLTIGILIFIAVASIRWFFPTPGALLSFAEKFLTLSQSTKDYIADPNISPIIFALIDVFFKIALFIVLFPVVKLLVNLLLIKPLWHFVFKPKRTKLHKKAYRQYGIEIDEKRQVTPHGRFFGGLIGAVRGLVTSIILLLPFIVLSGAFSQETFINPRNSNDVISPYELINLQNSEVETNVDQILGIGNEVIDVLRNFNRFGPGRFVKMVKTENGSVDEQIFDAIFGGEIKTIDEDGNEVTERLKLMRELNIYGSIAAVIVDGGYLDSNFDYMDINYDDDYENIDFVITSLGKSQIVNLAIPLTIDILDDQGIIDKQLGFSIKDVNGSDLTYRNIKAINWEEEFGLLSNVVGEVLKIGNVRELYAMVQSPSNLLQSSDDIKSGVINVLDEITNLQILVAGNIGVEYLIRNNDIQDQIKWVNNPSQYLRDKTQFIFNDHEFFTKELKTIHGILANVLKNHSDYEFNKILVDGKVNFDYILSEGTKDLFIETLTSALDLELFKNGLPVAIDYGVFVSPVDVSEAARDKIDEIIDNVNYEDEIGHLDSIYQNVINLGVSSLIQNNSQLITEVDKIMKKPEAFTNVKEIVETILIESEFVGEVIDYGFSRAVNQLVKNEDLKELLLEIDNLETFSYGLEVVNALNLAEEVYKFSDISTIMSRINNQEYLLLASELSDLGDTNQSAFIDKVLAFQFYSHIDNEAIQRLANLVPSVANQVVIPEGATGETVKKDLRIVLELGFEAAKQVKDNNLAEANLQTIDLSQLVDTELFVEKLTFNKTDHEHSILLHTAVSQLKKQAVNVPSYGVVTISPYYQLLDASSEKWIDEVNILIAAAFDLVEGVKESDHFVLSLTNIRTLTNLANIPVELIYDLEANNRINKLGQSYNIKYNVTKAMTSQETNDILAKVLTDLFGKNITAVNLSLEEEWLDENGFYHNDELKDLIKAVKILNIRSTTNLQNTLLDNFFDLNKTQLEELFDSNYLRVMASRFLLSRTVREMLADSAQVDFDDLTFANVGRETVLEDSNNMTKEEVVNVFVAFKALGINDPANIQINNTTLKGLSNEQLDDVLDSNYFYQVIDLTLKSQLTVPESALEDNGMIKRSEVAALIEALEILDIDDNISVENVRLSQVEQLIALDSRIIDKLISDEVVGIVDVPEASKDAEGNVTNDELGNLVAAMYIISSDPDPLLDDVDMENVRLSQVEDLISLDSKIVDKLISVEVVDIVTVPEASKDAEGNVTNDELANLVAAMYIISSDPDPLLDDIDMENVRLSQVEQLIDLDSGIVDKLISDEVVGIVDVPEASKDAEGNITNDELANLIEAIYVVSTDSDPLLNEIDMETTTLTTTIFDELIAIGDSPIINRLISEGIIETISSDILDGLLINDDKDVIRTEIVKLNESLKELGLTELSSNIDVDAITTNELIAVTDENNHDISTIVYRLLSNSTKTALGDDDVEIALDGQYIELNELHKLFKGLNELTVVDNITQLNGTNFLEVEFTEIIAANSHDSNIIRRLISKELINSNHIETDGFVENEGQGNLELVEEDHLEDFLAAADSLDDIDTVQDLIDELQNPNQAVLLLKLQSWAGSNAYDESEILAATIDKKIDEIMNP